jgi:6-phosphogluconolactonase
LTSLGFSSCGGDWPRNFALSPAGEFILVANQKSDEVAILPLERATGMPGEMLAGAAARGPACIKFAATNT